MKEKLKGLDAVRAFACVGIFTFHCWLNEAGPFAVSVFFVLSGFLMMYNYFDREGFRPGGIKGCLRFSLTRILRFYPLYALSMYIFAAFVFLVGWEIMTAAERFGTLGELLLVSTLMQSWVPNKSMALNGATWYLSDMLFIYMLFPPMVKLLRGYKSRKSAFAAIGAAALLMLAAGFIITAAYKGTPDPAVTAQVDMENYFSYVFPPSRLLDFFVGCNLGYLFLTREKKPLSSGKATVLELLAIGGSVLAYRVYCMSIFSTAFNMSLLFLLPSSVLVYVFALGKGKIAALLDCRPVHFIAGLSAEIFLIHQVVIKLGEAVIDRLPIPFWLMKWGGFAAIAAATLLLSWIYKHYFGADRAKRKESV